MPGRGKPTAETLSRQPLFVGVPPVALAAVMECCDLRVLQVGEVLLRPGQFNEYLYLVVDGRLQVYIDRIDADASISIGLGECVGEISIIDRKPATAFVVAEEVSTLIVIPEQVLWDGLLTLPGVNKNFMRMLAGRFRARNEAMQQALEHELRFEHLQKELDLARKIQAGLLPPRLDLAPEFEVAAEMIPAREIGGDFYDTFVLNDDEHCVAVGDVSGKGIPAALFMVRTITLLRTEILKMQSLDRAVDALNRTLCEENPTYMFTTLVVGILNRRTRSFQYVNAGHHPIILGEQGECYRELPRVDGIPLGIEASACYEVVPLELSPGDLILLYTDGVTEAMNAAHELFTKERLMACLGRVRAESVGELARRIKLEVAAFVGDAPLSDDSTMVIMRCCA